MGKLQLMEHEGGVDRLAVDSPPGRDVGLVELHEQPEDPSQTQELQGRMSEGEVPRGTRLRVRMPVQPGGQTRARGSVGGGSLGGSIAPSLASGLAESGRTREYPESGPRRLVGMTKQI